MKGLIIGAGNIGAGYDTPSSKHILTHAHAYTKSEKISEFRLCEPDEEQLNKQSQIWRVKGYSNVDDALDDYRPDIISICVPTDKHFELVQKIIKSECRTIILEKPLTSTVEQSLELMDLIKDSTINFTVNYTRRFDIFLSELKDSFEKGNLGKALAVNGIYTKGLKHNGSHFINLMQFLFGECLSSLSLQGRNDYFEDDPSIDCFLSFEKCSNVHLTCGDESNFSIFEYDLIFEKVRYTFFQSGLKCRVQKVRTDPVFEGYKDLEEGAVAPTSLNMAMLNLINSSIENKTISSIEEALKTQQICEHLYNQFKG